MKNQRQGIIVWFHHMKNLKQLKRHGHLIYASKRMKYAVIYIDQAEIEAVENRLLNYSFVRKVDRSYKPFINTTYENARPDKAKQYDYKMGI